MSLTKGVSEPYPVRIPGDNFGGEHFGEIMGTHND